MPNDLFKRPWPFDDLPQGKAKCILADPPWRFYNFSKAGEVKNPVSKYPCMDAKELAALPVRDLADPAGCALVMWATAPMLDKAFDLMKEWGFTFKSAGAWGKMTKNGKMSFGPGYCYRSAAEFWLLGTIGRVEYRSRSIRNLIIAAVREHSRKPDQMREMCEAQFHGPYIELFARQTAPGWSSWGNEMHRFDEQPAPPAGKSELLSIEKDK